MWGKALKFTEDEWRNEYDSDKNRQILMIVIIIMGYDAYNL